MISIKLKAEIERIYTMAESAEQYDYRAYSDTTNALYDMDLEPEVYEQIKKDVAEILAV